MRGGEEVASRRAAIGGDGRGMRWRSVRGGEKRGRRERHHCVDALTNGRGPSMAFDLQESSCSAKVAGRGVRTAGWRGGR